MLSSPDVGVVSPTSTTSILTLMNADAPLRMSTPVAAGLFATHARRHVYSYPLCTIPPLLHIRAREGCGW
eukprot:16853-Eustigmatos_ZCMA.PRE.1